MASPAPPMLPLEILYCIIDHTKDDFTLGSWSLTCRKHRTAVLCRKRSEFYVNAALLNLPMMTLPTNPTYFRRATNHHPRLDPLVRILKLDLGSKSRPDVVVDSAPRLIFDHMVNPLGIHLPHWPSLRQINHGGVLYEEFLEEIVEHVCCLESLTLRNMSQDWRQVRDRYRLFPLDLLPQPINVDSLDFTCLGHLKGLRNLQISHLLPGEGKGLGAALKGLCDLKVLKLMVAPAYHPYFLQDGQAPTFSPFDDLFKALYPDVLQSGHQAFGGEPAYGFSSSLQVLEIFDDTSTDSALTTRFFDTRVHSHPTLSSCQIHMKSFNQSLTASTSSMLRAYLSPEVKRLTLSYAGSLMDPEYLSEMEAIEISNAIRPFQATIEVLSVPAWCFFKNHASPGGRIINEMLESLELYRVLLLGSAQVESSSEFRDCRLSSYIFGSKHRRSMHDTAEGSWCRRIRHIWLGDVFVIELDIDLVRPANGTLDGLVVLFIPLPEISPADLNESVQETTDWYEEKVWHVAEDIAFQRFPALRVIVIGKLRYWIEIKEEPLLPRIWHLARAKRDPKQATDMAKYLTKSDWRFIYPTYKMEAEKSLANIEFRKLEDVVGEIPAADREKAGFEEQDNCRDQSGIA